MACKSSTHSRTFCSEHLQLEMSCAPMQTNLISWQGQACNVPFSAVWLGLFGKCASRHPPCRAVASLAVPAKRRLQELDY